MSQEILIILVVNLIGLIMGVVYFITPSFTKRIIGENDPFEKKIFHANLPFWQFLLLTVFSPAVILAIVSLLFTIKSRDVVTLTLFGEKLSFWGMMVCLSVMSYGVGSHGTSVSIGHYMKDLKDTRAYNAVEFYHHIFSHFLAITGLVTIFFFLAIYEINHPLLSPASIYEQLITSVCGIIMGIIVAFIIIEGRAKYYGIPAIALSLMTLFFMTNDLNLNVSYYPMVLYVLVMNVICLITVMTWKLRNGELKERLGEFFHE